MDETEVIPPREVRAYAVRQILPCVRYGMWRAAAKYACDAVTGRIS